MLFDTLCRIAEQSKSEQLTARSIDNSKTVNIFNNPYFYNLLKETKIFEFKVSKLIKKLKTIVETNEKIDTEFAEEYVEATKHNLPFKVCYFHFYFDPDDDYIDMGILVITTSMLHILEFYIIAGDKDMISGCCGRMDNRSSEEWKFEVVNEFHYKKAENLIIIDDPEKIEKTSEVGVNHHENLMRIHGYFSTAMALIYHPKQFVFEEGPVDIPHRKGKKIKRSHQRPKYTVLNPYEIRTILQVHNETGRIVSGHDRRGFERTYRHPKYKKMQGKKQWIDPVWVGPSSKTIGNKIYKVRLDI